jgi:hypothetical protein
VPARSLQGQRPLPRPPMDPARMDPARPRRFPRPEPGPTAIGSSARVTPRYGGSARAEGPANLRSNGPCPKPRPTTGLPRHASDKEVPAPGGQHGGIHPLHPVGPTGKEAIGMDTPPGHLVGHR